MNDKELELMRQETDAPYIKRTVDGREYTVKIHFHPDSHETASEKLKRIMLNDIKSGVLQEEIISENMAPSDADENGTQCVPISDGTAPADSLHTV